VIRPAHDGDVAALVPLMRAYSEFYEASPADEGLERMARALIGGSDSDGILLCACDGEADDEVVGFAACGWKWSSLRAARITVLEDLFVAPDQRGAGIGIALIDACAQRSAELGAPAMEWLTAPDNHAAQSAYDRTGAESKPFLVYELKLGNLR